MESNLKTLNYIMDRYNLTKEEKRELFNLIKDIFYHDEFQKRMTDEYKHHNKLILGYHLLEDTVVTYIFSKKYIKDDNFDLNIALNISMLHDLYTSPWQNKKKSLNFWNQHAFRHPIESVINSTIWYPELFESKKDAEKIIDGIVHHMYPIPVLSFNNDIENNLELKNFQKIHLVNKSNLILLQNSSNIGKVGNLSLKKSSFKEGRVVALVDKYVSLNNFDINSLSALITGYNKNLDESIKMKKYK